MRIRIVPFLMLVLLVACSSVAKPPAVTDTGVRTLRTPIELRAVRGTASGACPASLTAPAGGALVPMAETCLAVDAPGLSVSRVSSIAVSADPTGPDRWQLAATLTPEQRGAFTDLTKRLVGKQLAMVVDGVAYSAPR
jgi:preprotein translocase subunit SecD